MRGKAHTSTADRSLPDAGCHKGKDAEIISLLAEGEEPERKRRDFHIASETRIRSCSSGPSSSAIEKSISRDVLDISAQP